MSEPAGKTGPTTVNRVSIYFGQDQRKPLPGESTSSSRTCLC